MISPIRLLALLAVLGLAACEPEQETYPVSGQECGPNDPVQDFGGTDCISPAGSGV